jgi:hypothetical protein
VASVLKIKAMADKAQSSLERQQQLIKELVRGESKPLP